MFAFLLELKKGAGGSHFGTGESPWHRYDMINDMILASD
jgi:hypothetical protein